MWEPPSDGSQTIPRQASGRSAAPGRTPADGRLLSLLFIAFKRRFEMGGCRVEEHDANHVSFVLWCLYAGGAAGHHTQLPRPPPRAHVGRRRRPSTAFPSHEDFLHVATPAGGSWPRGECILKGATPAGGPRSQPTSKPATSWARGQKDSAGGGGYTI